VRAIAGVCTGIYYAVAGPLAAGDVHGVDFSIE
jgi:hypothetical protein